MIAVIPMGLYFWFVTLCGLIYSGIIQIVRGKLVDMKRMKEVQKEMNRLNKEYIEAMKKKNTKNMEEIQEKQNKVMPEFNGMMVGQLKVMAVIIVIFMSFMWALGTIDPHKNDDTTVELTKEGDAWCGEIPLSGGEKGPWYVDVKAFEGDSQRAENGTIVYSGVDGASFLPSGTISGEKMDVYSEKERYDHNENAVVCAEPPAYTTSVVATANSGTWFHVKLPFQIPILNTRTLNGVNIWFIIVAFVGGIGIGRIKSALEKEK